MDKTLPEDLQFKILNILSKHFESYEHFYSINSRYSGKIIYIDLILSYAKSNTLAQTIEDNNKIEQDIKEQIPSCKVNFILYTGE